MIWIPIAIWLAAGTSLLGPPAIWERPDPMVRRGHYRPGPVEYRTWTASPSQNMKTGVCTITVFALATREKLTRLRINGNEQLLDWSWSWIAEMPAGFYGDGMVVEFIDPVSHEVVAEHNVSATCPHLNQEVWQ